MRMQGSRRIAAPPDVVWRKLNDPDVLRECIPGCESMQEVGDGAYTARVKLKIGPVAASFDGRLALTNVVEGRSYSLNFEGQGGAAGFGNGTADVSLEPENGATLLKFTTDTRVGGRIAQVGQRLIDGVARKMADDFFARFETAVVGATERAPAAPRERRRRAWAAWVAASLAVIVLVLLAYWLLA